MNRKPKTEDTNYCTGNRVRESKNIERFIGKVQKYLDLEKLTPTILNDMVNEIYVYALDKSN